MIADMKSVIEKNKAWIEETWQKLDNKLSRVAVKSREKIPYTTVNGVHDNRAEKDPDWWTNGFWGGMMWLMYKETGNEEYKTTAIRSEEILDEALKKYEALHHDVGFMWHITSGANYRITGDKTAYNKNLFIAATLASRYNIDGKFIRAWNDWGDGSSNAGVSIIDCLMNIPMLYWASDVIGDTRFKKIAMSHADMALRDHIRPDGSVNHIVEHDVDTGEVVCVRDGQGYSPESCWSRGLAWAIYGTVLSYIHTGKQDYLDAAVKTANYFIANCARTGYLPVIDFKSPETPVYYDSTAGACAACGLIEIAKYVTEQEAKMYTEAAINILRAMSDNWCNYGEDEDAILLMGSERYPLNEEVLKTVHIPIIYGDFFFVEAIAKLRGSDFLIW